MNQQQLNEELLNKISGGTLTKDAYETADSLIEIMHGFNADTPGTYSLDDCLAYAKELFTGDPYSTTHSEKDLNDFLTYIRNNWDRK